MMKTIYVYTGEGAYQAKDVETFLAVFDFDYVRVSEAEFGKLSLDGVFIVPGGQISAILPAWGHGGVEKVEQFVSSGGVYLGICAGAYIAGKSFNGVSGLGFMPIVFERQEHQSIINTQDESGDTVQLVAENGPRLSAPEEGRVLLTDTQGNPQAIQLPHGRGAVYLFSSHPEGSVFYKHYPQEFSGAAFLDTLLKQLTR